MVQLLQGPKVTGCCVQGSAIRQPNALHRSSLQRSWMKSNWCRMCLLLYRSTRFQHQCCESRSMPPEVPRSDLGSDTKRLVKILPTGFREMCQSFSPSPSDQRCWAFGRTFRRLVLGGFLSMTRYWPMGNPSLWSPCGDSRILSAKVV